jgi:hypothetical protein
VNVTALVVIGTLAGAAGGGAFQDPAAQPRAAARATPDPRRQDITIMELTLTRALATGAQDLARQLKVAEPNSAFVTGTGRARGFILQGYGMFFDVDVPGMKQSVVWSAQMVQLAQERERALRALAAMRPDDPLRKIAMENVRMINGYINAAQAGQVLLPAPPEPTASMQIAAPPQNRFVEAATVPAADVAAAVPPPSPAVAPVQELRQVDPNELYTEAVKNALIEAMLKYSGFLKIAENEWLTVAASDSDGPQTPGQFDDTSRILISIKGADLAAFQSGKLTREEVMKKVEVREF